MPKVFFCKVCEAVYPEGFVDSRIKEPLYQMTEEHKTNCYYCGNALLTTKEDLDVFGKEYFTYHTLTNKSAMDWVVLVREKYLSNNNELDEDKRKQRLIKEEINKAIESKLFDDLIMREEAKRKKKEKDNKVRCVFCGSDQIQLVARKWSLFSGFFTNKVDRVCMKCKTKF